MESRALYSTDQGYDEGSWVDGELYDGAFVQAFGTGAGTVVWRGNRATSSGQISRHADRTGCFSRISGVIHLDGYERPVLYRMRDISLSPDEDGHRLFGGPVQWFTDEPSLQWLNDRWGFEEGEIDVNTLRF